MPESPTLVRIGNAADVLTHARQWTAQRLGSIHHERRVQRIAGCLFDLTSGFHDLRRWHRRVLRLAACLHDVGRCHGPEEHHVVGARMILRDRELRLGRRERRIVAFLTRFHRGREPRAEDVRKWQLGADEEAVQILAALLRAGDALDGRRLNIDSLSVRRSGHALTVTCRVRRHRRRTLRILARRNKRLAHLSRLLDLDVCLRVYRSLVG